MIEQVGGTVLARCTPPSRSTIADLVVAWRAAKMQMGQEVDLDSLEPQLLIYREAERNRENLQNAAHRVGDKKMERWEKGVE
jgi:hypothetical protein